ncbi:glycosyl hydrolase family 18 protein [Streptomyces sp. JJ36]|uniref:chitinase C-terminal domain-containing protein n=1 Tax=Streptomyces sp. JJ36 TaxID=2736645 RepID=UPI001F00E513|nr:glycosyl hydrolase family 18 protein [Streptomyces sp. JJ36]
MSPRIRPRHTLAAAAAAVAGLLFGALSPTTSQAAGDHASCRPDGLYTTPGVDVPYCTVYDDTGREKMGADHPRRVIGYFTGWRTGENGQARYLASDIPWDKVTHLNYAFAHVDGSNRLSVGPDGPDNPATGMTWPGVEGAAMDPDLPYQGHFNLLNTFKKDHPQVKTMVSVGGWAETGGYFGPDGERVDSGGFYTMATHADGSVNHAGIETFADSAVDFVRTYGFNGVDIDYEYATSMQDAGNPLDWEVANARRAGLVKGYAELMRVLREKLDRAGAADGQHYLLTVAAPSSGYLLRGMETYQMQKYLDYVNIMSYDLHGAWNEYVGPNAALYDDGRDAELAAAGVYTTSQYGGTGYLNTDWAYHYFRGSMPAGRINIGLPYYTRGWKNVSGGTDGLWGTAPSTDCPAGSGLTECGDGATGIDNLWHDKDTEGRESPAGSNPMWHAKNLEEGIVGDYVTDYGLPADTTLTGDYVRRYSEELVAPWLWNEEKKVFLATEDEQSVAAKAQYVVDRGIGGTMVWELAGDYGWDEAAGRYGPGDTLMSLMYETFRTAAPYGAQRATTGLPSEALDITTEFTDFPLGDSNYPISPELRITNNSAVTLPGGTEFRFDYATSAPGNAKDQSGWGLEVVRSDHRGPNTGGLDGPYHRVSLSLPDWQTLPPGETVSLDFVYHLPVSTPSNWTVSFGGKSYGLAGDLTRGTTVVDGSGGSDGGTGGDGGGSDGGSTGGTGECTAPAWDASTVYTGDDTVAHDGHTWRAQWWTQGDEPGTTGEWGVWEDLGTC